MKQDDMKTSAYWYHYYLFKDIEFQTEAYLLRDILIEKYPDLSGYDEGWLKLADAKPEDLEMARDLAARYQTSAEQVYRFMSGFYDDHPINPPLASGKVKNGHIIIEFDPYMTEDQYRTQWGVYKSLKKDLGIDPDARLRGPKDYELIYAIHRARHSEPRQSFGNIYSLYKSRNLKGYTGSNDRFSYYKDLEDHYHVHKFIK